jgi:diacylglycerol O-acyltransferase / wax synthase
MQRLTGLDATFLYLETPTSPMHVASVIVFDPSTVPGGFSADKVLDMYRERLHLAPPFRRRLVEVPFALHHPLWIEDPDFDLGWHVRHIAVPAPGGTDELNKLVSHLVAIPLDRTRPLWEAWILEGLEDGNVALLTKVHHSAIDGAAGNQIMVAMFDLTPEGSPIPPPETPWEPDVVPNDTQLVGYAASSLARQPLRAVKAARRTTEVALNIRRKNREPDVKPPPAPFTAPRTSINQPLTPRRSFETTTLSLTTVKKIKNAFGTTVNDVVLALCAGALRRYFDARDEVLDAPLVAMVPVSVRTEDAGSGEGNQVSSMLASLATDIDDPVERLQSISRGMRIAKEQQNLIGADTLQEWVEFAAPAVAGTAARLYSRTRISGRHRPLFNVTISNIPGPPFPLYLAGGQVKATYPVGPIFDGGGLNMTVMSYLDSMDFGLLACPDVVPDVSELGRGLGESLTELEKLADS